MINGKQLRDAFISGANNLCNRKAEVDALNVFPVPDGDTGTNMSMTIGNGAKELEKLGDDVTVEEVAKVAASGFLRGARGNSGVILSLLFRGFSKGMKGKETATGADIAAAFSLGVEAAYKAVMKPTEGTILTVSRCAAEKASEIVKYDDSTVAVLYGMYLQSKRTLAQTPEMLPILKKSGVVDAGGQGLVYIFEGMWSVISEGKIILPGSGEAEESKTVEYAYCVEAVVKRGENTSSNLEKAISAFGEVVEYTEGTVGAKFHVHTNEPGNVINEALSYGVLNAVKVENMHLSHTSLEADLECSPEEESKEEKFPYVEVDPSVEYGFVSVCAGKGLTDVFADLGCDNIVSGGQTMNPSTEDILAAVQATPAKNVFVLPNNKNIIMAAMQAAEIADRNVVVIPSRTVPQGISAMLSYDCDASVKENTEAMNEALSSVVTGQVTFAARDSDFDGHKIKEGELLAMKEGKMIYTGKEMDLICSRLAKALVSKETSMVTIYYGEDVTEEQAEAIRTVIEGKLPNSIEVNTIYGGQPVYYYIISAE
ncbi:MAG: DAK2 domain-containing protein [Oscillospiraceae bacterium]|nr:DAK2 domain-containing protein [Oscillospiraceae bacterium]